MYNSVRLGDTPMCRRKAGSRPARGAALAPALTSTPLHPPIVMNNRRNGALLGPGRVRRGSLSDVTRTPPKYVNSVVEPPSSPPRLAHNASGPLLASTDYGVSLSTYVDSKSPGFASRVVQYSEERERSQPTHQAKYGSPGSFPVVHLFKKDLPVVTPKPRRVTVRIGSSDCSRYNSPEHNRLLLEDMMREGDNSSRTSQQSNDVSNRSVLDALKEISRKRIHPSEEYDISEESVKRLRPDCINGDSYYTMRSREASPRGDNQKVCIVDPFYASSASTTLEKERLKKLLTVPGEKTTVQFLEEPCKKDSDVSVVSVETQTTISADVPQPPQDAKADITEEVQEDEIPTKESSKDMDDRPAKKVRKAPLRIFDEKPLEIMRKNRLAMLLGALTGEKPVLIPKEDKLAKFREEMEKEEEEEKLKEQSSHEEEQQMSEKEPAAELKSILSGGKSFGSAEKHVQFTFSELTSGSDVLAASTASQILLMSSPSITQTSTSVVTPVVSPSVSDSPSFFINSTLDTQYKNSLTVPQPISTPSQSLMFNFGNNTPPVSSSSESSLGGSQLSIPHTSEQQLSILGSISQLPSPGSLQFNLGNNSEKPTLSVPGGFQFSSTNLASTPGTTPVTTFSLGSPSSTVKASSPSGGFKFGSTTETDAAAPKMGGFKFDLNKPTSSASSSHSTSEQPQQLQLFNKPSEPAKASNSLSGNTTGISFGGPPTSSVAAPTSSEQTANKPMFNFGSNTSFGTGTTASTITNNQIFKFSASMPTQKSEASAVQPTFGPASVPGGFSFAPNNPQFGGSKSEASNTSTSAPIFARSTLPSGNSPFMFGNTNTSAPSFGATTSVTDSKPNATTMFGTASSTSAPTFGATTTNSAFGNTTSNVNTVNAFGNTTVNNAPSFGSTTTVATFGGTTNNSVPSFGSSTINPSPGFGTTQNASSPPAYGSTTSGTALPPFGTAPNTSAFPAITSTSTGFGGSTGGPLFSSTQPASTTSSTPAFGSTFPGFGNKSSGFGDGNAVSTSAINMFGTSVTTTSSGFGAASKSGFNMTAGSGAPMFGSGATQSPFGATVQPTPHFGSPAPTFGAPSTNFGGTAPTTAAPSFGSTNTPAFASATSPFAPPATTNSALGSTNTSAPMFGGPTPNSMFGGSGGANTMFGNAVKPLFGAGATPSFGGVNTTTASSGFGNTTTPTFGFGNAPSTTTNTFGGSAPAFGTTTTASSAFGTGSAPAFGSTGSFAFNNPANSTTSGGLGTTTTSSFGSSGFGSGGSSFGTTSTGGFGAPSNSGGFGTGVTTTNSFGVPPNTTANMFGSSGFGGSNAASPFGAKPQATFGSPATNASNTFGNSAGGSAFGNTPNTAGFPGAQPAPTQNGIFTFGSSNVQQPQQQQQQQQQQQPSNTGGFSFGSTDTKPTFNFTAGGGAPTFGAASAPSFGAAPPPAFGAPSGGQFSGAPAMFSIGSGATPVKGRHQLRAKRRT